jgi:hypothetical protein
VLRFQTQLQALGADAFHKCIKSEDGEIASNLTELGLMLFQTAGSLTSINIPVKSDINRSMDVFELHQLGKYCYSSGITVIKTSAFSGCTSLNTITIPGSVKQLSGSVFDRLPELSVNKCCI